MTAALPLRIGDVDRDRAISALGDHYAAGRLTVEEFDERSSRAMRARTAEDLSPLFADLPGGGRVLEPAPRVRPGPTRRYPPMGAGRRPPLVFLPVILLAVAVVAIVAALPWPLLILFCWWAFGSMFRFAHWRSSAQRHVRPHGWS